MSMTNATSFKAGAQAASRLFTGCTMKDETKNVGTEGMSKGMVCFLFVAGAILLVGAEETQDPEALFNEAKALGIRNDMVTFGKGNLTIRGTSLEGDGVKRPSMLLARAAELWAERALISGTFDPNTKFNIHGKYDDMTRALLIWSELKDWNTPVAYLRQFRKQHAQGNATLAAACDYEIAQCYEKQGDHASAIELYKAYALVPCEDDNIGRCKAAYALYLIKEGQFKEAYDMAKEVLSKCRPQDISISQDKDAHGLALQAVHSVPVEFRAEGEKIQNAEEANLLAQAKENPRRYLRLGQLSEQRKELSRAIEYYSQFRRNFPTDETALNLGVKIGGIYEQQKQTVKSLETYESVWKSHPNSPQAVAARVAAAKIHVQSNKAIEGIKLMQEGIEKSTAASVKADFIANLAEIQLANRQVDEASQLYIELMSKYGEQNAAKGAIEKLKKIAPSIKNWREITRKILAWLQPRGNIRPAAYGIYELKPQAASDLRRLALTFYVQNNDVRGGLSWLQQCGAKCREEDVSYIVVDEAWLYGEGLRTINAKFRKGLHLGDYPVLIDMGLRGWSIARDRNEGWDAIREAARFVVLVKPKTDRVRKLCDELKALRGTAYEDQATDLLIEILDAIGEKKEAEKIRQSL